jgi:type IV pilus assembly protein PilC
MKWYYTTNSTQDKQFGYIEANSLLLAKIKLKEQNIEFLKIKRVTWFFLFCNFIKEQYILNLAKQQNQLEFIRNLSVMLKSGISLLQSLNILLQDDNTKKQSVSKKIYHSLQSGDSVSIAFNKSKAFDQLLISLLQIGEHTGKLYEILDYYVNYQEKMLNLKRKIKISLAYPITVGIVATLMIIFMMFVVIPNFEILFLNSKIILPAITQILFHCAEFVRNNWLNLIIFFFIMIYSCYFIYNKFSIIQYLVYYTLFKLPIVGTIMQQFNMVIFAHTFAILYHSAIPIDVSLDKINLVISNPIYKKHLNAILSSIESGENLYDAVLKTKIFPKLVTATIHVGEETGELDTVLNNLGNSLEKTLGNKLSTLIAIFEPLTILLIMLVIGFILFALYLPLFNLGNLL